MFKDFIATLVTTIIAVSGAVADSTGHLTEKLGDVLVPVTTTSISYARVPARPVHAPIGIVRGESTTTPSTSTTVITQPVIEHVRETVHTVSGITEEMLEARLAATTRDFTNSLQLLSNTSHRQDVIVSDSIGDALGGTLQGLTIANSSWTGGTITNATITGGSISNYLPLSGGTLTGDLTLSGTLTAGTLSVAGLSSGSAITIPYLTATSTSATSTFAAGLQTTALSVTSSSASSTFANGINLSAGCFAVNGTCVGSSSFSNTLASGGTATTTFYNGGILFSDGSKLTQSTAPANLFWDEMNSRFGLGTSSPSAKLSITSGGTGTGRALAIADSNNIERVTFLDDGTLIARGKLIVSSTGNSYASDSGIGETGPGLYIRRQITDGSTNEHGIIDKTSFGSATFAYASFDSQVSFPNNPNNYNHFTGFQQRSSYDGSGTLGNYYSFLSIPVVSHAAGTITNVYHFSNNISNIVDGTIGNEYGLYIKPLDGVVKYGVYIAADPSYFGGNVTLEDDLLWDNDGGGNIGGAADNRPAVIRTTSDIIAGGSVSVAAGELFRFVNRGFIWATADGVIQLGNNANNDFDRLMFGGTTSSFPALKRNGAGIDFRFADDSGYATTTAMGGVFVGNVGIGTTSPWRKLSVTGTVGFDGLTGSTGAGSLCLDSNKQVVYNSASDNCLSSTRATKHDISDLDLDSLSLVDQLNPVSFIYNDGDGRVRYGFIAEDTANVDAHLATYDASGTVSGIDDRSIIAILVSAMKDLWAKIAALIQSDEEQDAEIAELKARVSELETAAAGTPAQGGSGGAPDGPSASMETSADAEDIATPSDGAPITSSASTTSNTSEAANDNEPVVAEDTTDATEPGEVAAQEPANHEPETSPTQPANDNLLLPTAEAI